MSYLKMLLFSSLLYAISSYAQDYQSKSDLEKEILGIWIHEDDSTIKISFDKKGVMKRFDDNELQWTSSYKISNTCNGEELEEGFFLKIKDPEGSSSCSYIEGINYNNNETFSLMTAHQGKVVVLKREDPR